MQYPVAYWKGHLRHWWGMFFILLIGVGGVIVADHLEIKLIGAVVWLWYVYLRVLRIKIPARSAAMRGGKIIAVCLEGDCRMIWDKDVFAKRIVCLECDEVDDTKYERVVVFPVQGYQVAVCRLIVTFEHIMHLDAWQRFYDAVIMSSEETEAVLHGVIDHAIGSVRRPPLDISSKVDELKSHVIAPFANALNAEAKVCGLVTNVECEIEFKRIHVVPRHQEAE